MLQNLNYFELQHDDAPGGRSYCKEVFYIQWLKTLYKIILMLCPRGENET